MLSFRFSRLSIHSRLLIPKATFAAHTNLCPTKKEAPKQGFCPGAKGSGGSAKTGDKGPLKRALTGGKVRMTFLPDEWFLFFHSKTGVTGPYIFGILLANYLVSKEIFVMEHEYYTGLSWFVIFVLASKYLGPGLASSLDADVKEVEDGFNNERKSEMEGHESLIKFSKDDQLRAQGQKLLMAAKKENIAMQLEAAYRERYMLVFRTVKGRMDYHVKRHQSEARIHQKWMIDWILQSVHKSITADFEKQAMDAAIQELASVASKPK